jgi:hypothetical protein
MEKSYFNNVQGGMRGWLRRSEYWKDGNDARALCCSEGYHSIALLRDPYDRLISAFANKYIINSNRKLTELDELEPMARAFYLNVISKKANKNPNFYNGITFREFAYSVCERIERRGANEPKLDHHWNTQVPFSFENEQFQYDEIYSLKSAHTFFNRIGALTGAQIFEEKLNRTKYAGKSERALQDVLSTEILQLEGFQKSQFKDEEIKKVIDSAFAVDYKYMDLAY